mgnify:CR=1 FL=1
MLLLRHSTARHEAPAITAAERATLLAILAKLTAAPVHLVLCDMNMPGMNGLDGLKRMMAAKGRRPVALISGAMTAALADQALAMLTDADADERELLGAFPYRRNEAVLHSDAALMPRRRKVWSAWNYAAQRDATHHELSVTYWMNRLQNLPGDLPLFVTLNPLTEPDPALVHRRDIYHHPVFDAAAGAAQGRLWSLQGRRNTWFCGAWMRNGFHEDGFASAVDVAEAMAARVALRLAA